LEERGLYSKDFYQIEPGDNIAPSKPTEVMLGYDERFLYVAFHCYDEPDKVRANIPKRDDIFNDDYVGILFDTFNDQRKAYEFDLNPLGIQADGTWNTGGNEDFSLDVVFQSKGMLTSGRSTRLKLRYRLSRFVITPAKMCCGARISGAASSASTTSSICGCRYHADISSWAGQEGHLTGFEGISTERTLELIPSLTISETGKRKAPVTLAQIAKGWQVRERTIKLDPGLTGKYSLNLKKSRSISQSTLTSRRSNQISLVVTANQTVSNLLCRETPVLS